ncbi:MAG: glucosamine-6-phosphate deaminase, partial [Thermoanaerobaculia bacterium]
MQVTIRNDPTAVARLAADSIARAVAAQPNLTLGLPTGQTMVSLYAELSSRHQNGELDLSRVRGFNLDELLLPPGHPSSFRQFMQEHAWEHTGLDPERCDIPRTKGDPIAECRRYDKLIEVAGGLDFAILGIGADGHVAYNLPGPIHESTHIVDVPRVVAKFFEISEDQLPLRAITIGLGPLRSAKSLLMLATGEAKAAALVALIEGPQDTRWPCSLLNEHSRFDVVIDAAAASLLHRNGLSVS